MKVILLADVKGQGKKDQMVEVSDGYARNYLLPKKLAVIADNKAQNEMKNKEEARLFRIEEEKKAARLLAERLAGITLKIRCASGAHSRKIQLPSCWRCKPKNSCSPAAFSAREPLILPVSNFRMAVIFACRRSRSPKNGCKNLSLRKEAICTLQQQFFSAVMIDQSCSTTSGHWSISS